MPKKNGYNMPEPIPKGTVVSDMQKKDWKIGPSIGKGGFGEIYSAQEANDKSTKYPFVIKIEPHENGPLFVEMHFYMKCGKSSDIEAFKSKNKLKTLGMPQYISSGSADINSKKYRFLVMEKFDNDVDKILKNFKGVLPVSSVFQLGWQITYVLQYIHEMGYIHADIKGANILMGSTASTAKQAYLVDYGLATKYNTNKEFKPNPKKAHDGTIEYLSRDAHQGVPTRRADFEILGYNMIYWLGGKLPWIKDIRDPKTVQRKKEEAMEDIPKFVKDAFSNTSPPDALVQLIKYINTLAYNDKPNYNKIRTIIEGEIKREGAEIGVVVFKEQKSAITKRKSLSPGQSPAKKTKTTKPKTVLKKTKKTVQDDGDDESQDGASSTSIDTKKVNVPDLNNSMEGFTSEMRIYKMKLKEKAKAKKVKKPKEEKILPKDTDRPRRNMRVVDYTDS